MAKADVAELQQLFDSVEAKQYKRPDMNEDLTGLCLKRLRRNEVEELDGHREVERRHGDGHPRLLSPHQRALGSVKGFQARLDKVEGRRSHKKHGRRRKQTIKAVYKNPRTGFGSIAQTLQQAQVRDSSILERR